MKNNFKLIGIIVLAAVFGFLVAACDNGTTGGSKPQTVSYTGTIGGTDYVLKITEKNARYAVQSGDVYELTAGSKKSAGTVQSVEGSVLTLKPLNKDANTFTATVSGSSLTALNGTITWTDSTTDYVSGTNNGGGGGGSGGGGGGGGGGGSSFGGSYVNANGWTIAAIDGIFGKDNKINTITYGNGKFVAGSDDGKIAYSTNGITWSIADTGTIFEYISSSETRYASVNSIAWGKDKFVAVGSIGKIATSSDGITWTAIPATNVFTELDGSFNFKLSIGSVVYGKDKFVAGYTNGYIATSSDGITWTAINPKSLFNSPGSFDLRLSINEIAYDGSGKFVAVGNSRETIAYSSNGINWTVPEMAEDMYIYDTITYGGGKFVAVAGNGEIATSPDGVTWTATASTFEKRLNCTAHGIAYGNGKFVVVGGKFFGNNMATSPDGVTWTNDLIEGLGETIGATFPYESLNAVTYGDGKFVAVGSLGHIAYLSVGTSTGGDGGGGGTAPTITTTTLTNGTVGKAYSRRLSVTGEMPITLSLDAGSSLPAGLTLSPAGVISGTPTSKGTFTFNVKATNAKGSPTKQLSITITSGDDLTWTDLPDRLFSDDAVWSIAYGNNKFVAGSYYGKMAYSSDGVSWTVSDSSFGNNYKVYGITYSNDKFVAVGGYIYGRVAYSSDGLTWTIVNNTNNIFGENKIRAIAYGNGKFVAVGENARIAYSPDGVSWTRVSSNTTFGQYTNIYGIAFGNGKFVAVGGEGKMAYSSDGMSWTTITNKEFTSDINAIIYDGIGKFVAGGDSGRMAYSSDGVSWTTVPDSTFSSLGIYTIAYGNGMYVAGGGGKTAFSSDGVYWTAVSSIRSLGVNAITFGNGKFVGGGNVITYSQDIPAPSGTPPTITTTSLPGGTMGTAYNQKLTATGDATITWSIDSGSLPGGLSLSNAGVISGTPTATGTFNFTVKAANFKGSITKSLTITIAASSSGGNPTPSGGTLTITGIPSQYNGMYALAFAGPDLDEDLYLIIDCIGADVDVDNETISLSPIANGSVSMPMWNIDKNDDISTRYSGDDVFIVIVYIQASSGYSDNVATIAVDKEFFVVTFSEGSVTTTWSDRIIVD